MLSKSYFNIWIPLLVLVAIIIAGCNYNYHQGLKLEKEGRFEEANVEFHRAYTSSPNNEDFKDAYLRTSVKTTEDLLLRYDQYVHEKKYFMAYRRLEQARTLTPDHPRIIEEQKKWFKILLAGRVDLVQIQSLKNQIPLTDEIILSIRINTPNVSRRLETPIDYQNKTFSVEDILYDPPQDLLMLYSINSIGVKLVDKSSGREDFKKFIDFKTPAPVKVQGTLESSENGLTPISEFYPVDTLKNANSSSFWYPSRGIRYSLLLDRNEVKVETSEGHIDFPPQMLYINRKDRRYFLDFGQLQLAQQRRGGNWSLKRVVNEDRVYMDDLQKNILLNTYFYFREGGYPFVKGDVNTSG